MRFHQRTLELFGRPGGSLDPDRGTRIQRIAEGVGVYLPAAVVDWYSNVSEVSDLWTWFLGSDYSAISFKPGEKQPWIEAAEREGDFLIEEPLRQGWWWGPRPRVDLRGLFRVPILPVVYETQGCCWWGVPLNGIDDPPVAVCFGDQGDQWDYFASSFSDFVLARLFDMSLFYRCEWKRTVILDEDLSRDQLLVLRQLFRPEVTTRQIGGELFVQRFSGEGQWFSITVAERDTRYTGSTEWQLMASSNDQFQTLVQTLRNVIHRMDGVQPGGSPLYLRGQMTAAEFVEHCKEIPF